MPDVNVAYPKLTEPEDAAYIFWTNWKQYRRHDGVSIAQNASFGPKETSEIFDHVDGEKFMKAMINYFLDRILTRPFLDRGKTRPGYRFWYTSKTSTEANTTLTWSWDNRHNLILDNTHSARIGTPSMIINKYFTLQMGWFKEVQRSITTGRNLTPVYPNRRAPENDSDGDLENDDKEAILWQLSKGRDSKGVNNQDIELSMVPYWHFHNLNEAFSKFMYGNLDRTLFVYCNAIASSIVGNQETTLTQKECQPNAKKNLTNGTKTNNKIPSTCSIFKKNL